MLGLDILKIRKMLLPGGDKRVSKIKDFLQSDATSVGGMYKEVNENPFDSVGVRFNRFILSPEFRLRHKFISDTRPDLKTKRFSLNFDNIDQAGEVNFFSKSNALTENIPKVDGVTERQLIGTGLIRGFDLARYDPDFQLFMVNLIQRNFMQFDSSGGDSSSKVSLGELKDFMSDMEIGRLTYPVNKGSDFLQSFFHFDLSQGDLALVSGDTVESAMLRIKIKAHFGERQIPSATFRSSASLFGDLRVVPRKFEILPVLKDYDLDYTLGNIADSRFNYSATESWDGFFGTAPTDVDESLKTEFVIDRPLKRDEVLSFDVTKIIQAAIDRHSSVARFVIRPKLDVYDRRLEDFNPFNGVGNHWFEFFRDKKDIDKRPNLEVRINPSRVSTPQRRARFRR